MLIWLIDEPFIRLITFRAALAGITAFVACVLLGPRVIAWLRSRRLGENVEKQDSKKLDMMMGHKTGTPTMGGVFVVTAILLSIALFGDFTNAVIWILVAVLAAFGVVGGVDDYTKLSGRSRTGMKMFTKLILQVVIGLGAGIALYLSLLGEPNSEIASRIHIPLGGYVDLGIFYPLFIMFVIVSTTNAVNITDGLDGLAGGCLAISMFAYAAIVYIVGRVDFSSYLEIPYVRSSAEVTVFCTAVLGAVLGFLWFNSYPAEVFLGDSGSLPLGAVLGMVACAAKQELLLFLVGGVFVIEVFSSFLQIVSYKTTGKRVFLIAPLHHHFQFKGMAEPKITLRFWIVAAVMAVASLALLKLQ